MTDTKLEACRQTARIRVKAGIATLDAVDPELLDGVLLDQLALDNPCMCVLGQVAHHFVVQDPDVWRETPNFYSVLRPEVRVVDGYQALRLTPALAAVMGMAMHEPGTPQYVDDQAIGFDYRHLQSEWEAQLIARSFKRGNTIRLAYEEEVTA